jgi:hypothetical protein
MGQEYRLEIEKAGNTSDNSVWNILAMENAEHCIGVFRGIPRDKCQHWRRLTEKNGYFVLTIAPCLASAIVPEELELYRNEIHRRIERIRKVYSMSRDLNAPQK